MESPPPDTKTTRLSMWIWTTPAPTPGGPASAFPTEEEWQYAAQGGDGRKYPWGNVLEADHCNGGETGGTTPVKAFPRGRSPCGCYDMCGNVWQWTESQRSDGHTRFCLIRGGSWFQAQGSGWYADGGPRPAGFAEKVLLTWPGLDRCATIGFRCAADLDSPRPVCDSGLIYWTLTR